MIYWRKKQSHSLGTEQCPLVLQDPSPKARHVWSSSPLLWDALESLSVDQRRVNVLLAYLGIMGAPAYYFLYPLYGYVGIPHSKDKKESFFPGFSVHNLFWFGLFFLCFKIKQWWLKWHKDSAHLGIWSQCRNAQPCEGFLPEVFFGPGRDKKRMQTTPSPVAHPKKKPQDTSQKPRLSKVFARVTHAHW